MYPLRNKFFGFCVATMAAVRAAIARRIFAAGGFIYGVKTVHFGVTTSLGVFRLLHGSFDSFQVSRGIEPGPHVSTWRCSRWVGRSLL